MTTVIRKQRQIQIVRQDTARELVRSGQSIGAPGAKGDPGGNVMAIGPFTSAHTLTIPTGAPLVHTSSYNGGQLGHAPYVRDSVVDSTIAAQFPRLIFQANDEDGNPHYYRFAGDRLTPLHMGVQDCINPRSMSEVAYDNKALLAEMWAYGHYLQFTRNIRVELNFVPCQGIGTSEQFEMYGTTSTSWWDSKRLNVVPGRLIALANMENLIRASGKSIQVADGLQWELQGAPYAEVAAGYGHILAKNLMLIEDAGGSNFGRISAWGCRRHIVRFSDVTGNNISITLGDVDGNRCGNWGTSGTLRMNGTYTGEWLNPLTDSDDYGQIHRMTFTPDDVAMIPFLSDFEVGDLICFPGSVTAGKIMNMPSPGVFDIYPWQPIESGSTYRSMHGGGVDCRGGNLANSTIGAVRVSVGGTVVRLGSEYSPKIGTVLGENVGCRVQVGIGQLEGLQGYREHVHHPENVIFDVIDAASSAFNFHFGSPSNMESNAEGRYGKVIRLDPARIIGGVWHPPYRRTVCGMTFDDAGGELSSAGVISVEKNLNGSAEAVISNSLQYRIGSVTADNFLLSLISEPSEARVFRRVEAFAGPFNGSGANGQPTGTIRFEINGLEVHPCTILGAAGPLDLSGFTTPVLFHYTFELDPDPAGDAHNWTINAIPLWQGVPMLGGATGSSGGLSAMPVDPLTLSPTAWFEPARSALYQDTGTATPASASGDPVGRLSDLSGNAHHATQSTSGKRPALRKLGALTYLQTDGVDDWLKTDGFTQAQPYTWAAAVLCDNAAGAIGDIYFAISSTAVLQAKESGDWRAYAGASVEGGTRDTAAHVLVAVMNGASSRLLIDGEEVLSGDFGSNACNGLYLFIGNDEATQAFKGAYFGGGLIPGALDDAQIAGVTAWLSVLAGK